MLQEDIQKDLLFNRIAERVYRKVMKHIEKATMTDNDDYVETVQRGNIRLRGIRMNVKDVGEKYDLPIVFAENMGQQQIAAYHLKRNFMIIFVFPRVSMLMPQLANEQTQERYVWTIRQRLANQHDRALLMDCFCHEFIHYLDAMRYGKSYEFIFPENDTQYFNSAEEFNVNCLQIFRAVFKRKRKFANIGYTKFLYLLRQNNYFLSNGFIKNISDDNKIRLYKRLYGLYMYISKNAPVA
jgi:hypothetical protein